MNESLGAVHIRDGGVDILRIINNEKNKALTYDSQSLVLFKYKGALTHPHLLLVFVFPNVEVA